MTRYQQWIISTKKCTNKYYIEHISGVITLSIISGVVVGVISGVIDGVISGVISVGYDVYVLTESNRISN